MPRLRRRAAVLLGGTVGSAVRIAAGDGVGVPGGQWPWVTLAVNVAGSFILAAVLTRWVPGRTSPVVVVLVGTGAMGAMTTFSTFTVETWRMGALGRPELAIVYAAVSVAAGFAAAVAGVRLAGRTA